MITNDVCDSKICMNQRMIESQTLSTNSIKRVIRRSCRRCSACNTLWNPSNLRCPCCGQALKLTLDEKQQQKVKRVYY